jgi:hypothetical protein
MTVPQAITRVLEMLAVQMLLAMPLFHLWALLRPLF